MKKTKPASRAPRRVQPIPMPAAVPPVILELGEAIELVGEVDELVEDLIVVVREVVDEVIELVALEVMVYVFSMQVPVEHRPSGLPLLAGMHTVPQDPQLYGSFETSKQVVPQLSSPEGQVGLLMQIPSKQAARRLLLPAHFVEHSPQLKALVKVETQFAPQSVKLNGQPRTSRRGILDIVPNRNF